MKFKDIIDRQSDIWLFSSILSEKLERPEKLVSAGMNDLVKRALDEADIIKARKIAVIEIIDNKKNFHITSSWNLISLNPNISFKQAYLEQRKIFESVKTISKTAVYNYDDIINIIRDLNNLSGLIVVEGETIKGFISLANFSESELDLVKKTPMTIEQIKIKAKLKGGLIGASLHNSYKGIDLRGADLRSANLSGADLSKANLSGADLSGAIINNANLTEAKLVRVKLTGANLKNSILINADLRNAELWHADLENTQLQGANLKDAVLYGANLKSAKLKNANLYNAGLMSANLEGADLSDADISNTNLKYANFDNATNLSGINMNSITIDNLTESALKVEWNTEVMQFLKKKYSQ